MATIVLIEDSPLVVQMLTMVCEGAGHQVTAFEQFADADAHLQDERPDLILTDLNLPGLPDDNTLITLRARPALKEIPIIIVSGRPRAELEQIAAAHGAQGALSKDDGLPALSAELPAMIDGLV